MDIYNAFLSADDQNGTAPELLEIPAKSKEDARRQAVKMLGIYDLKAVLSATSEEVIATDSSGKEYVYFGFDIE